VKWEIEFTGRALSHLKALRPFEQTLLLSEIERHNTLIIEGEEFPL
jgi:hypothetical protein